MKSSLPNPTKAEERRFEIIKREVGCLPCRRLGWGICWANAHHLIDPDTGERISHAATVPLCDAHHTGEDGIHTRKKWFHSWFGTNDELLIETDQLVADFESRTVGGS